MEGKVRMPASVHSVGATVGTVSLAPIGWVDSSEVLHTPSFGVILVIFRLLGYIGNFLGFECILVIFRFYIVYLNFRWVLVGISEFIN